MPGKETSKTLIEALRASALRGRPLRLEAMRLISTLEGYDWSGVYRLEGGELHLDEYVGAPTDHVRIPVGRGVCGTAVSEGRNQIVGDVRELANYLSCSAFTRSEIVVLIRRGERVLGQIDIDGHRVGQFDSSDEEMLEAVAAILAERWA